MLSEAEMIVDRRRLGRKVTFWRILAVLLALATTVALLWSSGPWDRRQYHIARIKIEGLITGDERTLDLLKSIEESDRVKALIVRIDSPGGTTSGSEAIYDQLRVIAKTKPIVAVMDTVAASGGYITALAADHIVARRNTLTGSIGVIFSFPQISKLLDTLGIKMEVLKSGELKAEPSPYTPMSDKVREVSNAMVMDGYEWFIGLVAERRQLPLDRVRVLADGRAYTGHQALEVKLIDEIGGEDKAVAWLESAKGIQKDLRIIDWKRRDETSPSLLGLSLGRSLLGALGLGSLTESAERAQLDGLLVLWHPQLQ